MERQSRLDSVKWLIRSATSTGGGLTSDALEQYWPALERALREQVAPAATAPVSDDELVDRAARTLHGFLPFPMRFLIRPERVSSWCLRNRDRLVSAVRAGGEP